MSEASQYIAAGMLIASGIVITLCQIKIMIEAVESNRLLELILEKLK